MWISKIPIQTNTFFRLSYLQFKECNASLIFISSENHLLYVLQIANYMRVIRHHVLFGNLTKKSNYHRNNYIFFALVIISCPQLTLNLIMTPRRCHEIFLRIHFISEKKTLLNNKFCFVQINKWIVNWWSSMIFK